MTGAVDFALDNHAIGRSVVAVMAVDEQRENGRDEEEDAVPRCVLEVHFLLFQTKTYMMPNAQEALSMAHCRSTFSP
jgi:hypothetical protein